MGNFKLKVAAKAFGMAMITVLVASCGASTSKPYDYTSFRQANPRSILVLPALNNTVSVEASEFFLSTVSRPFAERGYYIFPANMVKSVLENDGLADTSLVHEAETKRVGDLFGCDSALYLTIQKWESQYVVLATQTNVQIDYELKSCETGELLWENSQMMSYSPQSSSSGNLIADLVATAVVAALEKGMPNYIPLAQQANAIAAGQVGYGLPSGPYLPETYRQDLDAFPIPVEMTAEKSS